jgi:hypothetical protein
MTKQKAKVETKAETAGTSTNQISDTDLVALVATARELLAGDFVGTPLKFAKGNWTKTVFENDQKVEIEIGATETFIVDPLSHASGWVKWLDAKPAGRIGPGRLVDGFVLPTRNRVPDRDEAQWPLRGKLREDPWQEQHQFTVKSTVNGGLLTWVTATWGGKKAIGTFLKQYLAEAKRHPGEFPVVLLTSRDERDPDYGTIKKPVLRIVGWAAFGEGAAPAGSPTLAPALPPPRQAQQLLPPKQSLSSEMGGDEIPF